MSQNVALTSTIPSSGTPALTAHRRSLGALTGIRFFAAFYVVIFHTRIGTLFHEHGLHPLGFFFQNGFLAVTLFFVLSGFILAYTYQGQIETRADHRRFWEARFARLWPVYVVSLIMSSIPWMTFPTFGKGLATIFMVQSWDPFNIDLAGTWNFVCWTLSVEAFFYLLFPFFQVWIEKLTPRFQMVTIVLCALACILINTGYRGLSYPAAGIYRHIPLAVCHVPEFFTGVALGNYFLGRRSWVLPGRGLFTYMSAILATALLCIPPNPLTSVVVVGFSLLIFGLAAEHTALSRFLSTPAILAGGAISYSIYLVQLPVKGWVNLIADHLHLRSEIMRMGASTIALVLISYLLFRTVEDPARKQLRALFAAIERKRASAPPLTLAEQQPETSNS